MATIKREHKRMHLSVSAKHLQRYVDVFAARHGLGDKGTPDRMSVIYGRAVGRRLTWDQLADRRHEQN